MMEKTSNNDLSLQEFTAVIAGSWINPKTNNIYIFTPDPADNSKGQVNIKQNGTETLIPLRIALTRNAAGIQVLVENAAYTVNFVKEPEPMLTIDLEPAGIVELKKLS
jgi:hypothetical protein